MVLSIVIGRLDFYLYVIGTVILALVYFTYLRHLSYFSKQKVKFIHGWPVVGSMLSMLIGQESLTSVANKFYNAFPNERFVGFFDLLGSPVYMIRDPELIKQIAIKDFDHFTNHRMIVGKSDPLVARSLVMMRNDRWRNMRATLSPAFTGSKMRPLMLLLSECAKKLTNVLINESDGKPKEYELRELFSRFASDAIATSAFGVEVNSLQDKDNEFYRTGANLLKCTVMQGLKILGYMSVPALMNVLKVKFFSDDQTKFFRDVIHGNINFREKNQVIRHDMIHLLMEAKKGNLQHNSKVEAALDDIGFSTAKESETVSTKKFADWQDDDIVAQCMIFFLAGLSSVTVAVGFLVHELVCNPDIQDRLHAEISVELRELNGEPLTYEAMQKMKYLDMVVSETLRRWSLGVFNDRYVNKPYVLESHDGTKVKLNVGDGVWFPVSALHMDPQYFPDPERFDPERFNDTNKRNIQSSVYLPFGIGPRNCIASRFALMEIKAMVVHLLSDFTFEKCAKTQDPLLLRKGPGVTVEPEKGFWAKLRPRVK